jgi:site-specific recombinase XerD
MIGDILQTFFIDYLPTQRGLRVSTVKSYRDCIRLFLLYVSQHIKCKVTKLEQKHFTMEHVLKFLTWLEEDRKCSVRTRNQRLAVLHTFFEYLALRVPEFVGEAKRISAIRSKRCHPPETFFLEQDEVNCILKSAASHRNFHLSLRDRTLLLFMYNTGARVQEIAGLRSDQLDLERLRVRLYGKGGKWRVCPLWTETVAALKDLLACRIGVLSLPVFVSQKGNALTRFGIYKIVRRHATEVSKKRLDGTAKPVSPHVFRHTTAIHLLESGVEVNVIRGWLGHVSLETTNRYAEISMSTKVKALEACRPPVADESHHQNIRWRDDKDLLNWLNAL